MKNLCSFEFDDCLMKVKDFKTDVQRIVLMRK